MRAHYENEPTATDIIAEKYKGAGNLLWVFEGCKKAVSMYMLGT